MLAERRELPLGKRLLLEKAVRTPNPVLTPSPGPDPTLHPGKRTVPEGSKAGLRKLYLKAGVCTGAWEGRELEDGGCSIHQKKGETVGSSGQGPCGFRSVAELLGAKAGINDGEVQCSSSGTVGMGDTEKTMVRCPLKSLTTTTEVTDSRHSSGEFQAVEGIRLVCPEEGDICELVFLRARRELISVACFHCFPTGPEFSAKSRGSGSPCGLQPPPASSPLLESRASTNLTATQAIVLSKPLKAKVKVPEKGPEVQISGHRKVEETFVLAVTAMKIKTVCLFVLAPSGDNLEPIIDV
ncbi:hypothetical protein JEQ12_003159 [Ovis aries]|uniref:Uncharacterized protein n=1 Tax=Ovis aries TaxID=9940 RepID=A0A836CZI5_SHEEP|nr:hypothetical protein JEQ12_003159 [Ovis aries]